MSASALLTLRIKLSRRWSIRSLIAATLKLRKSFSRQESFSRPF